MLLGPELGFLAVLTGIVMMGFIGFIIANDIGGWNAIDDVTIRIVGYQAIFILVSLCLTGLTTYVLAAGLTGLALGTVSSLRLFFSGRF